MTQDEIIELARQAGLPEAIIEMTPIAFEAFAKLVAEKEREECAKLADYLPVTTDGYLLPKSYADAIRARGQA